MQNLHRQSPREKCPYSGFFCSGFSRILTEYSVYSVSLRIQPECRKIRTRKTPNMDTFHTVFYYLYASKFGSVTLSFNYE